MLTRADGRQVAGIQTFKLPPSTVFKRHVVGKRETAIAGGERLIYSNTKGMYGARILPGFMIADDISTTSTDGCPLSRFTFQVTGQGNPDLPPAPYSVTWALYPGCPGAYAASVRPQFMIPGTSDTATFADGAPRTIEFIPPGPVDLPTNFWLALTFTGDNAGPIVGAPAFEGHSADVIDFPGFACNASLGGFPDQPHASFNVEVFGNACLETHQAYKAQQFSGVTYRGGRNRWFADDLHLIEDGCELVAYEVAVLQPARYTFELRYSACGGAIAGTRTEQVIGVPWGDHRRLIRKKVANICDEYSPAPTRECLQDSDCQDETHPDGDCLDPIPLPQNVWFAMFVNNDNGSAIVAGKQADIGSTQDLYARCNFDGTVELADLGDGIHSAFHISLTCADPAPKGACCDMYVTECAAGPDHGKPCRDNNDCSGTENTCEALCRELAHVNCSFPQPGHNLNPDWMEGAACDPDPFAHGTCGDAACCYKAENDMEYCSNLTKNECLAIPPVVNRRQWQIGRHCSINQQRCPLNECVDRAGSCPWPHTGCPDSGSAGCEDPDCCAAVCTYDATQAWCCQVCWDDGCALTARKICEFPASNDECSGPYESNGARLVMVPSFNETDHQRATEAESDPSFCCHSGTPLACTDDTGETSFICETDDDCAPNETCLPRPSVGLATVWYKFVAPPPILPGDETSSVSLDTCATSGSSVDSLLQAFSVGDATSDETACGSLIHIGCSDDVPGCSNGGLGSDLCLQELIPGDTYYVMVASKTAEGVDADYKLTVNSPCFDTGPVPNDYCLGALPVSDGPTDFDMTDATLHCPGDLCAPGMEKDLWFEYTATCTGRVAIDTCSDGQLNPPDTNLMVYEGCHECPSIDDPPLDCSSNTYECGDESPASFVEFPAINGECYKVRVGNEEDRNPAGVLRVTCEELCPEGDVWFVDPRNATTDARWPHDPNDALATLGIDTIVARAPAGVSRPEDCWRLCETELAGGEPNAITEIVEGPSGTYTISLQRPITTHAHTSIEYLGNNPPAVGRFFSHPGNTNDDFAVFAGSAVNLVNVLEGFQTLPFGEYSQDIDHSGAFTPIDILAAMDLLNGAEAFYEWNNSMKPGTAGCP